MSTYVSTPEALKLDTERPIKSLSAYISDIGKALDVYGVLRVRLNWEPRRWIEFSDGAGFNLRRVYSADRGAS